MIAAIIISIFSFVLLMVRAATREMHLCASLIKQSEATQQAERKSMNKSLAFASASHDIRAALAGITGLIELCYEEVPPRSELETNLKQMDGCTKDLVGKLTNNSSCPFWVLALQFNIYKICLTMLNYLFRIIEFYS